MTDFNEQRLSGIGGSDVAAILGVSKYRNALDVFNAKKGIEQIFPNIRMDVGTALEPLIFEYAKKEFSMQLEKGDFKRHKDYNFIIAHTDGYFYEGNEKGVLEIKTTSGYKDWGDDIPFEYYLQIQHYLLVNNLDVACLIVLYLNNMKMERYIYKKDNDWQNKILDKCIDFWNNHILTDIPPEIEYQKDIAKIMHRPEEFYEVQDDVLSEIQELNNLKSTRKIYDEKIEEIENHIKELIADKEGIMYANQILATYKSSVTSRFNSKLFKEQNEELYGKYLTSDISRRLLIKYKG